MMTNINYFSTWSKSVVHKIQWWEWIRFIIFINEKELWYKISLHGKSEKFWIQTTVEVFIQAKHKIIFISCLFPEISFWLFQYIICSFSYWQVFSLSFFFFFWLNCWKLHASTHICIKFTNSSFVYNSPWNNVKCHCI